jgi:fructose-specific phosphotransferase system IIC component
LLVPFMVTGGVLIALSLSYSGLLYKMTHYSGLLPPQ